MNNSTFFMYLAVMAGVTYLIRMIPLVLIKKKITNTFILSFLHYIPYTVLSVMTIPAIFHSTSSVYSATFGFAAALALAYRGKSLVYVACAACAVVFAVERMMSLI